MHDPAFNPFGTVPASHEIVSPGLIRWGDVVNVKKKSPPPWRSLRSARDNSAAMYQISPRYSCWCQRRHLIVMHAGVRVQTSCSRAGDVELHRWKRNPHSVGVK